MLADVVKAFAKEYEKHGENYITDSYIPADGKYIIIKEVEGQFEKVDEINIKQDKKTKKIDYASEYFDFIRQADYMSILLDMNKPIDSKKVIHSNNYLSFFIKQENVYNGKLTEEIIDNYYEVFINPYIKYKKPKAKKLYEAIEKKNGESEEEDIEKVKAWVKNNIYSLVNEESKDKSYLKIFFYYDDLERYRRESEKYILTNIYNTTDFNITINHQIYGLPNDNMGLNSKKPYLENKTRKTKIPYLVSQDQVLLQKKFFDYLMNQAAQRKVNIYVNENSIEALSNDETLEKNFKGYYLRIKKGKEVEVHDFDTVDDYKVNIKPMKVHNVLELEKSKIEYTSIGKIQGMKNIINEVFFSKFLAGNYFTEAKDLRINDNSLKRNLLLCRNALFAWFYKGNTNNVWKVLQQSSLDLIKGSIQNGYLLKASDQFNLRSSLKDYFDKAKGEKNMADVLMEAKNVLRTKINQNETESIENDKEYFFAVGQLTNYFISLNKGKNKVHSLANPIINAKTDKRIKDELQRMYKKYNYIINIGNKRFNRLYAMVSAYVPEGKIEEDLIIAGYLHSNLIYEKANKEENQDE